MLSSSMVEETFRRIAPTHEYAQVESFLNAYNVILGSSSLTRRGTLLSLLDKKPLLWISPSINEDLFSDADPFVCASKIAGAKADACMQLLRQGTICNVSECSSITDEVAVHRTLYGVKEAPSPCFLVCSDQVVLYGSELRQKPSNTTEAQSYIRDYSTLDIPIQTISAVVLINTFTGKRVAGTETAKVWFKAIPEDKIQKIIENGMVMHSCGGFSIDDVDMQPYVEKIEGKQDAIMGMPLQLLSDLIKQLAMADGGWENANIEACRSLADISNY